MLPASDTDSNNTTPIPTSSTLSQNTPSNYGSISAPQPILPHPSHQQEHDFSELSLSSTPPNPDVSEAAVGATISSSPEAGRASIRKGKNGKKGKKGRERRRTGSDEDTGQENPSESGNGTSEDGDGGQQGGHESTDGGELIAPKVRTQSDATHEELQSDHERISTSPPIARDFYGSEHSPPHNDLSIASTSPSSKSSPKRRARKGKAKAKPGENQEEGDDEDSNKNDGKMEGARKVAKTGGCFIGDLPNEVLVMVFSRLDEIGLARVGMVCCRWHFLSSLDSTWRAAFEYTFRISLSSTATTTSLDPIERPPILARRLDVRSWKGEYIKRVRLLHQWRKSKSATISSAPQHSAPVTTFETTFPKPSIPSLDFLTLSLKPNAHITPLINPHEQQQNKEEAPTTQNEINKREIHDNASSPSVASDTGNASVNKSSRSPGNKSSFSTSLTQRDLRAQSRQNAATLISVALPFSRATRSDPFTGKTDKGFIRADDRGVGGEIGGGHFGGGAGDIDATAVYVALDGVDGTSWPDVDNNDMAGSTLDSGGGGTSELGGGNISNGFFGGSAGLAKGGKIVWGMRNGEVRMSDLDTVVGNHATPGGRLRAGMTVRLGGRGEGHDRESEVTGLAFAPSRKGKGKSASMMESMATFTSNEIRNWRPGSGTGWFATCARDGFVKIWMSDQVVDSSGRDAGVGMVLWTNDHETKTACRRLTSSLPQTPHNSRELVDKDGPVDAGTVIKLDVLEGVKEQPNLAMVAVGSDLGAVYIWMGVEISGQAWAGRKKTSDRHAGSAGYGTFSGRGRTLDGLDGTDGDTFVVVPPPPSPPPRFTHNDDGTTTPLPMNSNSIDVLYIDRGNSTAAPSYPSDSFISSLTDLPSILFHREDDSYFQRAFPTLPGCPVLRYGNLLDHIGSITALKPDFANVMVSSSDSSSGNHPRTVTINDEVISLGNSEEDELSASKTFGDRKYVIAGDKQGRTFVWDWNSDDVLELVRNGGSKGEAPEDVIYPKKRLQGFEMKVTAIAITQTLVFVGTADGTLRCYDPLTSNLVRYFTDRAAPRQSARAIAAGVGGLAFEMNWAITNIRATKHAVVWNSGSRIMAWRVGGERRGAQNSGPKSAAPRWSWKSGFQQNYEMKQDIRESQATLERERESRSARTAIITTHRAPQGFEDMTDEEAIAYAMILSREEEDKELALRSIAEQEDTPGTFAMDEELIRSKRRSITPPLAGPSGSYHYEQPKNYNGDLWSEIEYSDEAVSSTGEKSTTPSDPSVFSSSGALKPNVAEAPSTSESDWPELGKPSRLPVPSTSPSPWLGLSNNIASSKGKKEQNQNSHLPQGPKTPHKDMQGAKPASKQREIPSSFRGLPQTSPTQEEVRFQEEMRLAIEISTREAQENGS